MKPLLSIDELMIFHEVLRAGSLTKASENLRTAKSTVSRRLMHLEEQLGAVLLKRNTRKLVATEIGQELFARCERILNEVSDLGSMVEFSRKEVRGTLRISIPTDFGTGWLGTAIADFALLHPDLQIEVEINVGPVNLIEEPYDIAVSFGRLDDSRMVCKRLAVLERGIFASQAYVRDRGEPLTLEDLPSHPFIVTDVQQREGTLVLRVANSRRRIAITRRVTVNSMRLARELVEAGVGLAVLPNRMCTRLVETGRLVPVLPRWKCPPVEATAVVLAREGIPRKTRAFLDFLSARMNGADAAKRG